MRTIIKSQLIASVVFNHKPWTTSVEKKMLYSSDILDMAKHLLDGAQE